MLSFETMKDGTGKLLRDICVTEKSQEVRNTLDLVGDKWSLLTVGLLEGGPHRFSQLLRELPGISQRMLTRTLRRLERDGLVSRTVYPTNPPSVEYALTDLGRSLSDAILPLIEWASTNHPNLSAAREAYDRASGQAAVAGE